MPVPGTHLLTEVTAKHPVVKLARHGLGQGIAQLDGEIADAPAAVYHLRPDDSLRGADVDAPRAVSTVVGNGSVRRQVQVDQNFPEEEMAPALLVEQQPVLPDPAETRLRRPRALQDRRRIDINPTGDVAPIPAHPLEQLLELPFDHKVVVLAEGIRRNLRRLRVLLADIRVVVVEEADDRLCAREQKARIKPLVEVLLEVGHAPVPFLGEPSGQPRLLRLEPLRLGEPHAREAQLLRPTADLRHPLLSDVRGAAHRGQPASKRPPPAEGTRPRCLYAASVACRPRGVRTRKPS